MTADMMDRLRTVCDLQARIRRVKDAAVEYAMACEACAQKAQEVSAWCRGGDGAEMDAVAQTLGSRMADARETARDLYRAAVCVADGAVGEAMSGMSHRERLEAWGMLIHGAVPEIDVLDSEGRMLAKGRSVCRTRSRRRRGLPGPCAEAGNG